MLENESGSSGELRRRAEAALERLPEGVTHLPPGVERLVRELRTQFVELQLQNEQLRKAQQELAESRDRFSDLYDFAPVGYVATSQQDLILEANLTFADMLRRQRRSLLNRHLSAFVLAEDEATYSRHCRALQQTKARQSCELRMQPDGGPPFWAEIQSTVVPGGVGDEIQIRSVITDVSDRKRANEELQRIKWLLTKKVECTPIGDDDSNVRQDHRDRSLDERDASYLIQDAVGDDLLAEVAQDFLCLLDTSAAIYEKNGDCVLGIFASGWCQFLDQASRKLCHLNEQGELLAGGQQPCLESCWDESAKQSIVTGQPVDLECRGGIRLYGVPIWAKGEVVGAISFGYGDPPRSLDELEEIARWFQVSVDDLLEQARAYESRPPFIIDIAKSRLHCAARLIGALVERRMAEKELSRSKSFLQTVIDAIPEMTLVIDRDYRIVLANRAARGRLGGTDPVVACLTCYRASHHRETACPNDVETCPLRKVIATKKPVQVEHTHFDADHNQFTVEIGAAPIFDESGEVVQIIQASRDVTARKRSERALAEAKQKAEAASRAKSRFLANMSHEIRTPMTSVMGFADLLLSRDPPPAERRQYLETIHENAENLLTILNDILDLTKIEAEKIEPELQDCSPTEIVEEVRSLLQIRANEKRLGLDVVHDFPLPKSIRTDPVRLRQILVNLVGNAIKFTERGLVKIMVRCVRQPKSASRMQFEVSDTGIGLSNTEVAVLFEPFTQIEDSSTRRFGGTGLGLSISQRLARLLGGQIDVASEPGSGSTFTLTIDPGPLEGVGMLESPAAASGQRRKPKEEFRDQMLHGRVLLAEDDEGIQSLLRRFLEQSGLEVDLAPDGRVTYEKAMQSQAAGRPYDLILMDIRMPQMDGYEVTRRLRHVGWKGPIVAQTAHALTGDRQKCLDAGCDDYITKPVRPGELFGKIVHYLPQPEGGLPLERNPHAAS